MFFLDFFQEQHEYRYRLLLRCLLHLVGVPDTRKECSHDQLIKHVKTIFYVSDGLHKRLVEEEQIEKPVVLHVSKLAAKLLKHPENPNCINPYCIVSLVTRVEKQNSAFYVNKSKSEDNDLNKSTSLPRIFNNDPYSSPQLQHHNSCSALPPKASASKLKKLQYSHIEVRRTSAICKTVNPIWHDNFEIGVGNIQEEEIQFYIWDANKEEMPSCYTKSEKSSNFRNIIKMMKHSFDHSNPLEDMLGFFSIPVKDIPSAGCEQWFPLYSKRKGGAPISGKLHVNLTLQAKLPQQRQEPDGVESDQCSLEDFYQILKILHIDSAKDVKKNGADYYKGHLKVASKVVARHFCTQNNISKLTRGIINCAVLMEWNKSICKEQTGIVMSSKTISMHLKNLLEETKIITDWEVVENVYKSIDDLLAVSSYEIELFDQAASWFIEDYLSSREGINISFFPIDSSNNLDIKHNLKVIELLFELQLTTKPMSYMFTISNHLTSKVKRDTYINLDAMFESQEVEDRDGEKTIAGIMTNIVSKCIEVAQDALHNNVVFSNLSFDYATVLATAIDEKVVILSKSVISKMDKYLIRYQSYEINVKEGSTISLKLYFGLKNLYKVLSNLLQNSNSIQKLSLTSEPSLQLSDYCSWFQSHFQFWLLTFRNECLSRTQRAVEVDSAPTQVVEGSEISVSCVDTISCFIQVCLEWKRIEYNDKELCLVAITKLTDAICDGARHYVKHLLHAAYDLFDGEENQSVVSFQCCLIINNMEHVRRFLPTVPEKLQWEKVVEQQYCADSDHQVKVQSLKTLSRLLKCAERDIREHLDSMLSKIGCHLSHDIHVCLLKWTDPLNQAQEVDSLLKGLDENLQSLHSHLKNTVFKPLLMELWKIILQSLDKSVLNGESPEYAQNILKNLELVRDYFLELGLVHKEITNNYVYQQLYRRLDYNAKSTIDLQLAYFEELANNMDTPIDYHGHLSVKFGFQEENQGKYVLYVYVLRASHLPGLDHSGFSDPYVSLELLPNPLFPNFIKQKTRVAKETLNPIFNQLFLIPDVSSESFKTPGAILRLAVKDFDKIGSNDFAGEIFIHLSQASDISKLVSVDFLPALMLPLKRPVERDGAFQALKDRRKWDKEAKAFVTKRMKVISNQKERTDNKSPKKSGGIFSLINSPTSS